MDTWSMMGACGRIKARQREPKFLSLPPLSTPAGRRPSSLYRHSTCSPALPSWPCPWPLSPRRSRSAPSRRSRTPSSRSPRSVVCVLLAGATVSYAIPPTVHQLWLHDVAAVHRPRRQLALAPLDRGRDQLLLWQRLERLPLPRCDDMRAGTRLLLPYSHGF
jgi:hypothetical protein